MSKKTKSTTKQQPTALSTDFLGEGRRELVAKLAYKLWEERGQPIGSPEVDWFAAEREVYAQLVASGLIDASAIDPQQMAERIYARGFADTNIQ